jgi:hypothetical protein
MTQTSLFTLVYRSLMTDTSVIFLNEGGARPGLRPSETAMICRGKISALSKQFYRKKTTTTGQ